MIKEDWQKVGYYFFLIKFFTITIGALILSNSILGIYGVWCGVLALIVRLGIVLPDENSQIKPFKKGDEE